MNKVDANNETFLLSNHINGYIGLFTLQKVYLRNRSAPAVNCCLIIHCLDVSCIEDQIKSV